MADLYQHDGHKFADAGLQLRTPVDLVPANQYSELTNALPIIEGRLEARAALKWIVNVPDTTLPGSGLHSLTRLNQPAISGVGDRVAGVDTTVQTFALPAGNVATSRDTARTGDPLSLPNFHFSGDTAAWQLLADRSGMKKYKSTASGAYYQTLGIFAPFGANPSDIPATASAGAAGNLNNGSGPGYDWLYTYVNTANLSESNPSPVNLLVGGVFDIKHPATITTPDPSFGGSAFSASAAGPPATGTGIASSTTETRQSILFSNWAAPTGQYQILQLGLMFTVSVTGGTTGGCVYCACYFSLDNGTTWKLGYDGSITFNPTAGCILLNLPINTDITRLRVRFVVLGVGNTTVPQNVTARRIRDRAGNLNVNDLLTGGGGNRTIQININDVFTSGVLLTATVNTLALTNQQASVCVFSPAFVDSQVDAIRLYRRGGSVTASWAFVGQFSVASLVQGTCSSQHLLITDNVADANLGNFISFLNDAPITSVYALARPLPYIWGPGFNPPLLFGCGDPDRPDAVYFSNPSNADQWGVGQWVDVSSPSDPMQHGCVFNTSVFAFSKERMFQLVPSLIGGATVTPFQTPCSRGLISPYGLLATARMIYFVAKDGIYSTTGGEEVSLVENDIKPLFPTLDNPLGRLVEGYDSVDLERVEDIRLHFHNDELWFLYRGLTTGQLQSLVYDQNKKRWRAAVYPVNITTVYSEQGTVSSLLLGDSTGSMYSTQLGTGDVLQASTVNIPVTIRTGAFDQGLPLNQKEYGNVLFDIDPGGATVGNPVTITPLLNGETITDAAITITGSGRQQVPLPLGDVFGFNIEFQITFIRSSSINPILYQFDVLWRQEPAQVTHWEARESSYGLIGWMHARDANIAIRSNGNVTLTMTFDGTAQTYVLASTGGLRRKVYVPFHSNKGKVYKFSFDTSDGSQFRLYQEDAELRLKPWVTDLGYQVLRAFGGEATLAATDIESQLLGGK